MLTPSSWLPRRLGTRHTLRGRCAAPLARWLGWRAAARVRTVPAPLLPPPVSSHPAAQTSNLLGKKVPGLRDACEKAVAAHAESDLPWLTTVGWDAMITSDGVFFFEGNVAAYRTPRRMFLTPSLTTEFLRDRDC